ncbi:MAG: hypothetical protein HQ596_05700 [Candidatus Saganbacteria bacterium]|nr:hypothetical protein [Candidatus Saganbacteria bacterium]
MVRLLATLLILFAFQFPGFCQEINVPFKPMKETSYFDSPQVMIDSIEYDTLILSLNMKSKDNVKILWTNSFSRTFNLSKSIAFRAKPGQHKYYFDLPRQNPLWLGWITKLILYPEKGQENIRFAQAVLVKGNFFTRILSAWQEFGGPKGRIIEGYSINNMQTSRIFGKPLKIYIYIIIILLGLFSFLYHLFKSKSLAFSWHNCGKIVILTSIAFWVLLTLNNLVNQYNQLKLDFAVYNFKSLSEKRAALVGTDFYNFLMFCQENIPQRATVKTLYSGALSDYSRGQTTFYLYPLDFFAQSPDFIIAYRYAEPAKEVLAENKDFSLYKQYSNQGYILKKRRNK